MRVIAVINQKGGVGKSTTAFAIGVGFSMKNFKTLFIDMDAQGSLSYTLGVDTANTAEANTLSVLAGETRAAEAIRTTIHGDVIASTPALAGADTLLTTVGKEFRLSEAIEPLKALYDIIIVDTPPALGILTVNALAACTDALIPAQADIYSLQGIRQLYGTLQAVQKYCNPHLRIMGILLTRFSGRTIIGREIAELIEEMAEQLQTKLYTTRIRESTAIKEAQARRQSIYTYAPKSNAAEDYNALMDEILAEEYADNGK